MLGSVAPVPEHQILLCKIFATNELLRQDLGSSFEYPPWIKTTSINSPCNTFFRRLGSHIETVMLVRGPTHHGSAGLLKNSLTGRRNRVRPNNFSTTHEIIPQTLQTDLQVEFTSTINDASQGFPITQNTIGSDLAKHFEPSTSWGRPDATLHWMTIWTPGETKNFIALMGRTSDPFTTLKLKIILKGQCFDKIGPRR